MDSSLPSPAPPLAINSLKLGWSSRACPPLAETSFQSITPSNTMDIQKRTVFAVELEFTLTSQIRERAAYYYFASFFRPLPLFRGALFVGEESCRRLRPVPLGAAKP